MNILHVANFNLFNYGSSYYAIDRKLSNGLIRNGHFVYDFSYRDVARSETIFRTKKMGVKPMNEKLKQAVENLSPDLILLGNAELVTPQTLKEIRKMRPGIRIALWFVDWLMEPKKTDKIKAKLDQLDAVFCTTGGEQLAQLRGRHNSANFMPNIVDGSIEALQNNTVDNLPVDLIFCGKDHHETERTQMLRRLQNNLPNIHFKNYGSPFGPAVFGANYRKALAEAKSGLNYSRRNDIYLYSSDRMIQLLGNGLLTFTPRIPGMEKLFDENEVAYFNSEEELVEKLLLFSENDQERKAVATRGRIKAHRDFSAERIAEYIVNLTFDQPSPHIYSWL